MSEYDQIGGGDESHPANQAIGERTPSGSDAREMDSPPPQHDIYSLVKRLHDVAERIDEIADALADHFMRDEGDRQCGDPGCACTGEQETSA